MDLTSRRGAIGVLGLAPLLMASDCSTTNRFVEIVPTRAVQDGAVYVRVDRLAVTDRGWGGTRADPTGTFDVSIDAAGVHPLATAYPFAEEPADRGPVGNGLRYVASAYGDGVAPRWTLPIDAECTEESFAVGSPDRKTVLVGQGCKASVRLCFLTADGAERRSLRVPRDGGIWGPGSGLPSPTTIASRSAPANGRRRAFLQATEPSSAPAKSSPSARRSRPAGTARRRTVSRTSWNLEILRGIFASVTFVPVAVTSAYANYGPG